MNKQVIFMDSEGNIQGGIYCPDLHGVICGCCGGLLDDDDIVIIHWYEDWLNISEEICGDDGAVLHELEEKVDRLTTSEIEAILDGKKDFNA